MLNVHRTRTSIWRLTPCPTRRVVGWELNPLQQPRSYSQLPTQGVDSTARPSLFPGHGAVERRGARDCACQILSYDEHRSKLLSIHVIGTRWYKSLWVWTIQQCIQKIMPHIWRFKFCGMWNDTNHVSSVKASEEEIQLSLKALNVCKATFRNTHHWRDLKQSRVELYFLLACWIDI